MFYQSGLQQACLLPFITRPRREVTIIMGYLFHIDMFKDVTTVVPVQSIHIIRFLL